VVRIHLLRHVLLKTVVTVLFRKMWESCVADTKIKTNLQSVCFWRVENLFLSKQMKEYLNIWVPGGFWIPCYIMLVNFHSHSSTSRDRAIGPIITAVKKDLLSPPPPHKNERNRTILVLRPRFNSSELGLKILRSLFLSWDYYFLRCFV